MVIHCYMKSLMSIVISCKCCMLELLFLILKTNISCEFMWPGCDGLQNVTVDSFNMSDSTATAVKYVFVSCGIHCILHFTISTININLFLNF